jgi:hypothetical protein
MFSNGLFALGFFGPLILFWLCHTLVGLAIALAALVTRLRANSESRKIGRPRPIVWAIAILACAEIASIVGASVLHIDGSIGSIIVVVGLLVMWPISAILSLMGKRAVGQKVLLIGHGLIAVETGALFLAWSLWNHGMIGDYSTH